MILSMLEFGACLGYVKTNGRAFFREEFACSLFTMAYLADASPPTSTTDAS
jgi:hypothetical protein